MQVVNSNTGQLTDAWTLTKPVGWQPNVTRQTATISDFVSNYTESTWEQVLPPLSLSRCSSHDNKLTTQTLKMLRRCQGCSLLT